MLYGANMLSLVPGEWLVANGSVSSTAIMLAAGGFATQTLDTADLATIPAQLLVSVLAARYTNPYDPDLFIIIHVESAAGEAYDYTIPIIDTAAGICTIVIPTTEIAYTILTFTLKALNNVTITEWGLFAPLTQSVDFTEVKGMIPRLLNDYNRFLFTVDYHEDIIAQISAYITEATEMSGHLSISYVATTNASLILRIRDNNTEELYSPIIFNLTAGAGTIGLPHAYLLKEAGYHDFTVSAQVTSGTVQIDTRKILYVIDGAHFAYSLLDVGSVVVDLSVKKLHGETAISAIYAACIDDGICLIKTCAYDNILANAWISLATLGPATGAAIEFGGLWDITVNPYTFDTEEFPWVGLITLTGDLNVVKPIEGAVPITLATNVLQVCSVVGWNNVYTPGLDQGVIFAYIKTNGLAYYRAYCLQADYTYLWENERQIVEFTGIAVNINAFRTIDFRLGFNILANTGITYTYITTRNWAGMSIPIEHLSMSIGEMSLVVTEINYFETTEEENLSSEITATITALWALVPFILSAMNIDDGFGNCGLKVITTFDSSVLGDLSVNATAFKITDSMGGAWSSTTITRIDARTFEITFIDFNNADPTSTTIEYVPGTLSGEVELILACNLPFSPVGLIPTVLPQPIPIAFSNSNATTLLISFDIPVKSANWALVKNALVLSAQEYNMIPDGLLSTIPYTIDSVTHRPTQEALPALSSASLTDTIIEGNAIKLALA